MPSLPTSPSTPLSCTSLDDKAPESLHLSPPSPLTLQQAIILATQMRQGLVEKTKDRLWHFKTYQDCFKNNHALTWALAHVNSKEYIAVNVLNQLIDFGLLCHVVDPSKKFRVGDTRTLYFRMVHDVLDGDISQEVLDEEEAQHRIISLNNSDVTLKTQSPMINVNMRSRLEKNIMADMQTKLENVDHVLQETVQELNAVHGKLEIVHQEVISLVSLQLSMMAVVLLLYIYIMFALVPSVPGMSWFSIPGLLAAVILILSTKSGMACVLMWSQLDGRIVPTETSTDDESTVANDARNSLSFERQSASSRVVGTILSKSMIGANSFQREGSQEKIKKQIFMRDSYSLPDVKTWPNRPILICANSPVSPNFKVPDYGLGPCPLGTPFKFSSELFEGKCLIRIKASKSDDPDGDAEYFSGKKRIFQSIVQGRFKEEVRVSEVLTGHEFGRPLKNLPHPWVLKTASNFIAKIASGANVVVHTDQPKVEAILAGTSQVMRGDEPGNEPNITSRNIQEDCSVFGGTFSKGNMSISRRKRLFSSPERCKNIMFDTETIYTFEFYQNLFDANTYSLDLGFSKIGCSKVLDGQPIQWLGKMRDGRYLWSFQVWHEKLLTGQNSEK